MRMDISNTTKLYGQLQLGKEIGKLAFTANQFDNVFFTINTINALDEDNKMVGGYMIDDYVIASEWSFFIVPSKISFNSDSLAKDFKDVDYYKNFEKKDNARLLSPSEFNLIWKAIVGSYKSKNLNMVKVSEARKGVTLMDSNVTPRLMTKDMTECQVEVTTPLYVTICPFEDAKFGSNVEQHISKLFSDIINKLR